MGAPIEGPLPTPPGTALVETLQVVARRVVALTAAAVERCSSDPITLAQYRTLVVLGGHPGARAGEVAAELGVSPPAVTRLVRTLMRRGLIVRRIDEGDRRQVDLRLTSRGAHLVASVARFREEQFRRAVTDLSDAERDALLSGLQRLVHGLELATR